VGERRSGQLAPARSGSTGRDNAAGDRRVRCVPGPAGTSVGPTLLAVPAGRL